jgi:hypothetical protein
MAGDGAAVDGAAEFGQLVGDLLPGPLLLPAPGLNLLNHPRRGRLRAVVRNRGPVEESSSPCRRQRLTHFEAHAREIPIPAATCAMGRFRQRSTSRRRPSTDSGALRCDIRASPFASSTRMSRLVATHPCREGPARPATSLQPARRQRPAPQQLAATEALPPAGCLVRIASSFTLVAARVEACTVLIQLARHRPQGPDGDPTPSSTESAPYPPHGASQHQVRLVQF